MLASTTHGALGTGTSSLKVFQDSSLTSTCCHAYARRPRVHPGGRLQLFGREREKSAWNSKRRLVLSGRRRPDKTLAVESGRVGGSQFTLEAKRIGKFNLTLAPE